MERKEREFIEAAERLKIQQQEIFFGKKKAKLANLGQNLELSSMTARSKPKPNRYPNPEEMYR